MNLLNDACELIRIFVCTGGGGTAVIMLTIFDDTIQNERTWETNSPVFVHPWPTPCPLLCFLNCGVLTAGEMSNELGRND